MTPPAATAAGTRRGALAPRAPRRVSGPVAVPSRAPAAPFRPSPTIPFGARVAGLVRRAPDHAVTHRLARGRAWIVLLAVALAGIVFVQVTLLGMNAGIGRAIERSAALERVNASLQREISAGSSDDRILSAAVGMGFIQPAAGSPRYLAATRGDTRRALAALGRGAAAGGPGLASAPTDATAGSGSVADITSGSGTAAPPAVEAPMPPGAQTADPNAPSGTNAPSGSTTTTTAPPAGPAAPTPTGSAPTVAAAGGGTAASGQ